MISFVVDVLFPPFLVVLGIILVLASLGRSLGIRKLYVKFLLKVFEVSHKLWDFLHFFEESFFYKFAGSVSDEHKAKIRQERKVSFSFGDISDSETEDDSGNFFLSRFESWSYLFF